MLRKIVSAAILIPLALVLVAWAVANRDAVTVSFDLFGALGRDKTLPVPLSAVAFLVLLSGVLVGGIAAWLAQGKWRRKARRLERELAAERAESDRLRQKPAEPAPHPLSLRPPAA
jgi:uncharacterized integral membrane protein